MLFRSFAIVLILLSLFQFYIGESRKMYVFSIVITSVFAVLSVLDFFDIKLAVIDNIMVHLPLYTDGLGWVLPALVVAIIGFVVDKIQGKVFVQR